MQKQAIASDIVAHDLVRKRFLALLDQLAGEATGGTTRIRRVILLEVPPSIDAAEITDKGSINQRAVLEHRAALVEELYAATPSSRTLCANLGEHSY